VQCRADDAITRGRIAALHHAPTAAAVALERDLLALLGGGCQLPFGAFVQGEAWAFALGSGAGVIVRQGTGASAARAALRALAEVRAGEADHETYGCEWEEVHVGA
jgi:porphobilinogen deaminase